MCAGVISGGNNTNCGVGIAYDAQIASKKTRTQLGIEEM